MSEIVWLVPEIFKMAVKCKNCTVFRQLCCFYLLLSTPRLPLGTLGMGARRHAFRERPRLIRRPNLRPSQTRVRSATFAWQPARSFRVARCSAMHIFSFSSFRRTLSTTWPPYISHYLPGCKMECNFRLLLIAVFVWQFGPLFKSDCWRTDYPIFNPNFCSWFLCTGKGFSVAFSVIGRRTFA